MPKIPNLILAGFSCLIFLISCNSEEDGGNNVKKEYDQAAMLAHFSDNLIVPGYLELKTKTAALQTAVTAFANNPDAAGLTAVRNQYLEANLAYQQVAALEFGPADEQLLRNNLAIFTTNSTQIENNIAAGSYNLSTSANLSAKGFPALDYLLYSKANESEVLALYTSDAQAANRKKYLQDITSNINQLAEAVHTGWTTGNYQATFKAAAGTAVGSGVGNLVNQLNFDIDIVKRAKIGIPAGRFTAGSPLPDKAEAYYSKYSLELLTKAVQAEKAIFLGQTPAGVNGPGLDDYLNHLEIKYSNDQPLANVITTQFDAVLAAINAVPAPLTNALASQPQSVNKVYEEMQKLIVLTKTDMPSALGVSITYTDNDGD